MTTTAPQHKIPMRIAFIIAASFNLPLKLNLPES
jgi:hypothetical protein